MEVFNDTNAVLNDTASSRNPILDDHTMYTIEQAIWFTLLPLSVMGVATNIINIRVFIEQGVRNDSTNIGFVCLSIWDLLNCATLIPYCICFVASYTDGLAEHLTCRAFSIQFIYAHIAFQHIGAWTTVYISLMRCCCVIFPLKVKFIFTPKTTIVFIVVTFIFFSSFQTAYGLLTVVKWVFHRGLNTTIAVALDTPEAQTYIVYKMLLLYQILPVIAVLIVSINTILLGQKLLEVKKWRQKNSSGSENEAKQDDDTKKPLASKEVELIKFINTVTSIFLACFLMSLLPSIPVMLLDEVNFTGLNSNLFFIFFWVRFLFDAVNSSINFFFYIRVSSRYKSAFASAFKMCAPKDWIEN